MLVVKNIDKFKITKSNNVLNNIKNITIGDKVISKNDCGVVIQKLKNFIAVKFNNYVETFEYTKVKRKENILYIDKTDKNIKTDSILYGRASGCYGMGKHR